MAPDASVIILSFNQFAETTGPCLDSLLPVDDIDLELIVVDNGSDNGTRESLARAASRDRRVRLILNSENRGYAGGNNDGVAQADAELIVLLNSDTRVLPDAISILADRLRSTSVPIVLGPVTNAAGNEQQICIAGGDIQDVLMQGRAWSSHAGGSSFSTDLLSFFCVAMHRETYRRLGGLDESYRLGFYEDADFCLQAVRAGITLQVLEEAFVYHQGSASFGRIPAMTKKLLKENRRQFRRKNGRVKTAHVRDKNLLVLQGYLDELAESSGSPSLEFRMNNRYCRARELEPNNPLKTMFYRLRLKRVSRMAQQLGGFTLGKG